MLAPRQPAGLEPQPHRLLIEADALTDLARTQSKAFGGNLLIPKTLGQLIAVGAQMKASDGPPSPELVGRLHALQEKLHSVGLIDTVLLGVAVVAMASARNL